MKMKTWGRLAIFIAVLVAVSGGFGLIPSTTYAWTPVDRAFLYYGTSCTDTCTITFLESYWGEREGCSLHRVAISPEGTLVIDSVEHGWHGQYTRGDWREEMSFLRLRPSEEGFRSPFHTQAKVTTVQDPPYDSSFWKIWKDSIYNWELTRAHADFLDSIWLRSHIDHPACDKRLELVYSFPFGIYKNYQILDALAVNRYLFVLTYQPVGFGDNTYDGVLIYHILDR